MDLSGLSDKDLVAISKGDMKSVSDDGIKYLAQGPSLGQRALSAVNSVSRGIDSYTGAPARAAIGAAQNADTVSDIPKSALGAFVHQFGKDPDQAPTGEQIVQKAGVPEGIPSKAAGFAMDMAANPLNFVGTGAKLAGSAARALPAVSDGISAAGESLGNLGAKGAEYLTGKPKEAIKIYAQRAPEVMNVIHETGGELPVAADAMKEKVLSSIKNLKSQLSGEIGGALDTAQARSAPTVPSQPILQKLQAAKDKLNPHYNAADVAQIDEMMNAIQSSAPDGHLNLNNLFDTKNFLQSRSQGSFVKDGQLFISGDKASKAANDARFVAKDLLHQASPEIAHADSVFSDLHDLDDKMSASLLGTGKSENIFASAGGGKGNIHQVLLKKAGELTGTDPLSDAQLLYAAKSFKNNPTLRQAGLKALLDTGNFSGRGISAAASALPDGSAIPALGDVLEIPQSLNNLSRSPYRSVSDDKMDAIQRKLKGN